MRRSQWVTELVDSTPTTFFNGETKMSKKTQCNNRSKPYPSILMGMIISAALLLSGNAQSAPQPRLYVDNSAKQKLWTKNANIIPLCWFTPGYKNEKAIFQDAIKRTWVKAANLKVSWREGCPTTGFTSYVKVQIGKHTQVADQNGNLYYDHSTDGQTRGLGMNTLSKPNEIPSDPFSGAGMTFWMEDNGGSLKRIPRMEYIAVHEFGHVLGFQHEQDRPEAEARDCPGSTSVPGGIVLGLYDPESIMNYCGEHGNNSGTLSEGDIANVRDLYGFPIGTGTFFADLNGDKLGDAIAVNGEAIYGLLSDGSKLTNWGAWTAAPFYGYRETLFADINGDGRADAIAINNAAIFTMLSDGERFTNWAQWTDAPFYGSRKTAAADVNGDGKADVIAINNKGIYVMTSDGSKFTNWKKWTRSAYYGTRSTFVVDANGDKLADIVAISGDGVHVALSNGSTFVDNGIWSASFFGTRETTFADVNGDGRADGIAIDNDAIYVASLSQGSIFGNLSKWTTGAFYGTFLTPVIDLTGDGRADAIAVNAKGNYVMLSDGIKFNWSGKWSEPFYGGL